MVHAPMIDLTVMAQQVNSPPNCPLPAGFKLDEYCIERRLSLGGFSIVYVATDRHEPVSYTHLPTATRLRS